MKYHQVKDGEWIIVTTRNHKVACCDCGLIHKFDFKIGTKVPRGYKITSASKLKAIILRRAFRDDKATARRRKRLKITVKKGKR